MAGQLHGNPSEHKIAREAASMHALEEPQLITHKWHFSREEIEKHSPSRKDGIGLEKESNLRMLYCSFLQELGMGLKVPQVTIATAIMLCHRFYMRQSHATNDWQTIATVSMFLACKAEETPRWLNDLIVISYTLMYRWDPSAAQRIRQKEFYDRQKELILIGERLLLVTVAFDLNIEHPYKSLVAALKRMEIPQKEIVKVAWNFVNDWLRTTLCLQYKPHYIAAGSLFLAAKFLKVKLPAANGRVWWMQFDVLPKKLEDIVQQMLGLLEQNRKQTVPPLQGKVTESKPVDGKEESTSPKSCVSNGSVIEQDLSKIAGVSAEGLVKSAMYKCCQKQTYSDVCDTLRKFSSGQTRDCSSANSIIEDANGVPMAGVSHQKAGYKVVPVESGYGKIDVNRIREKLKRRKCGGVAKKTVEAAIDNDINSEGWIEKELERGLEQHGVVAEKRRRL